MAAPYFRFKKGDSLFLVFYGLVQEAELPQGDDV